jgi:hypothetical protein
MGYNELDMMVNDVCIYLHQLPIRYLSQDTSILVPIFSYLPSYHSNHCI